MIVKKCPLTLDFAKTIGSANCYEVGDYVVQAIFYESNISKHKDILEITKRIVAQENERFAKSAL